MTGSDRKPSGERLVPRLGLAVFLVWTGALIWLLASGRTTRFLRPELWPLVLVGAVLAGAFAAALLIRPRGGHGGSSETAWIRSSLLVVPVLYLLWSQGSTLGSYAFEKRAVGIAPGLTAGGEAGALPGADGRTSLLRIVRGGRRLEGKEVTTIGQVTRGVGEPDGHFVLFRFVITCCAADARPVGVLVRSDRPFPKETWIEVTGTARMTEVAGREALLLEPAEIREAEAPDPPYLYGL